MAVSYSRSAIPVPRPLDLSGNLTANWKIFKRDWSNYEIASKLNVEEPEVRVATFLSCIGREAMDVYDGFIFPDEKKIDMKQILDAFEKYCIGETNESYERFIFNSRNQREGESIDKYVAELRKLAKSCNYEILEESLIRDRIIIGIKCDTTRRRLLQESKLTLGKCIDIARSLESSKKQLMTMQTEPINEHYVKKVDRQKKSVPHPRGPRRNLPSPKKQKQSECQFCGTSHAMKKELCPAWGKACTFCHGRNHFKVKCKKRINAVHAESGPREDFTEQFDDMWLSAITTNKEKSTAVLKINDLPVRFQLDTAADVNTICQKYVRREQVKDTNQRLIMWNGSKMLPLGIAELEVINEKNYTRHMVEFTVVRNNYECLLGLNTVKNLNFVTINDGQFIANVSSNAADGLGDLGLAHLRVDPTIKPRVLPCRRLPFAIQGKVKSEIDKLVERGILQPVDEPTEWVSQMAIAEKSCGSIRICIDPQPLNKALLREHFRLPTLDDVLPELNGARIFSKLDVKEAYWHVRLDYESSLLTTMITPFGRFRWLRLPFGLKVSSEIFQKKLGEALLGLKNTVHIADDVIIAGCGRDDTEAEKNLQIRMNELRQRCQERHIRLNDKKAALKQHKVVFMGHMITRDGISPDPTKVEAIQHLPVPTDVSSVRRLCGTVQYLARYIPNLAQHLEPLRALTRKETPWKWTPECNVAFERIKSLVVEDTKLAYFDNDEDIVLQVDSSQDGVGAVIMQKGRPIEYASKTLSQTQRRWAQIEKELLAVIIGLERFDHYTYGRKVHVHNDHKPLANILKKPLSQAPRRLQNLLMRLYRYDCEFQYLEGKNLLIADTLSRAVGKDQHHEIPSLHINVLSSVTIPDATLENIKRATREDSYLQALVRYTCDGWPTKKHDIDPALMPYWQFCDSISVDDGVLYKGERVIVPKTLRQDIKAKLHAAHLGYDSMMRRARTTVFWPGMGHEIKLLADQCETCQHHKPANQREPLVHHEEGESPWDKVGIDLCENHGQDYLIVVDYFSNFTEIDSLTTTTTTQIIKKLKILFARWGIPKAIVSDCGPQFTSSEFRRFTDLWGIIHKTSSPHHHQSNGKAEAAVKSMKAMLKKCEENNQDPFRALLELRSTPKQDTHLSPAELMLGRRPRTLLPTKQPVKRNIEETKTRRQRRKDVIKRSFDQRAKNLPELRVGSAVYYKDPMNNWKPGIITEKKAQRAYEIEGQNGGRYTRNRVHIRKRHVHNDEFIDLPSHLSDDNTATRNEALPQGEPGHRYNLRPRANIPVRYKDYTTHY